VLLARLDDRDVLVRHKQRAIIERNIQQLWLIEKKTTSP
jgi:hypothetical protein